MSNGSEKSIDKAQVIDDTLYQHPYDPENGQHPTHPNAFGVREGEQLERGLKARHVAMISIGGVIGTGLFLGTGGALARAGPVGLWLGYMFMSTVCFAVMMSLGEVISYLPVPGGHIKLAERFVDPSFSAALGYLYVYNWAIVLAAELAAGATLIGYWNSSINPAAWVALLFCIVVTINLFGPRVYGEAEFWFASIKVITIVGLIILSFLMDVGAVGPRLGFQFWRDPGPFVQYKGIAGSWGRFLAWWSVASQAAFSFIGSEIVAIAAGESANPRRNLPRAIRTIYFRIFFFYILGTLAISVICPSNSPSLKGGHHNAAASPFVIAIRRAGISGLPSVINAALVTSATSAASSDLYVASRGLYGLAIAERAPRIFARTNRYGLPYIPMVLVSCVGLLGFMVANGDAYKVFNYFANLTSVAGLSTWAGICWIFIRFHAGMKKQGISRDILPFKAPLQPYLGYWGLFWSVVVIFFSGFPVFIKGNWDTATFVTSYLSILIAIVLYIGFKLYDRTPMIPLEELDFVSGVQEIIDAEEPEEPPKNFGEKIWRAIA